jgi:hypothetical protein
MTLQSARAAESHPGGQMRPLLVFLLLAPAWSRQVDEPSLENRLAAPVANYSLTADRSLDALEKAAGDFHVPIGIEWIKVTDATTQFSHSWQQTTPLEILQDIVKAYPGYAMEMGNGIVHVLPVALRGDSSDILNYRLDSFALRNASANEAAVKLVGEVKPLVAPRLPNEPNAQMGVSILGSSADRQMTLRFEKATVREILDRICVETDRGGWVVAYPPVPAKTRAGFLKTVRLSDSTVDEDWRFFPSWYVLSWREVPMVR